MCYDVAYQTKRTLDYARKRSYDAETIAELEDKWEKVRHIQPVRFHVSGFSHPYLLGYTNEEPFNPEPMYWGLVPFWAKGEKAAMQMANKTLNARGETIFEKPAFRESAKKRRCLIMVDHFYEHHHHQGKTYPFLIKLKNNEPLILAGLWSEWVNKSTGEILKTASIVTTRANELMAKIHNNPKLSEPRMPLMLRQDDQDSWLGLEGNVANQEDLKPLIAPYEVSEMTAYPVQKLRGKNAVGNEAQAMEKFHYEGLSL
ncbi:MAG: SOS response-associated peptidase [Owenweeksia sp.]|nr:SOS response-associated peptidase [Owenweeksia sp.]